MLILVYYYIYTVMLSVSVVETPGATAPHISGAVNGIKPLTEEDRFNNSQSYWIKVVFLVLFFYPLSAHTRHFPRNGESS